jgi:NAD(P)-dependent dehydrogenase (short-subunit alcohol dehydrogenase family)
MITKGGIWGKRALVTGATGAFGAHFARVLSSAGVKVTIAARREHLLRELAKDLVAGGGQITTVAMDVTNPVSVEAALEACGPVDILINNAGVTNSKPAMDQVEDDWDRILDTNLKGVWLVATETARSMRSAGIQGSIVNIASILGLRQAGHVSPYAISKAGVVQLTKQLALELARYNIRVNALAPGYFLTELNREFFAGDAGAALIKRIPQRRLGALEELNGPLLLLASDASRYMTGAVVPVDGGHLVSSL